MRKIQEKVRDIVEIGPYRPISNFDDDPALTLGAYCFTDATADLMARWLDRLLETGPGRGSACALAGYRGVGKSHFLAVIDVLASNPEQRALIPDQHVESSARRLMRRHYPVVRVRRGAGETLEAELNSALDATFGADASAGTAPARLEAVTEAHSDVPIVVIVDTAVERRHRVMRDDGAALAELGDLASRSSIFLAVALDDDIAAADGANSGISQKFTIDYLDQEHLYKVVNSSVFPKSSHELTLLHETYEYFREMLPGFRWSENRFAALYPLHPAILEVAPFVRLHVQDFAVLAFAAGAAERILPRPATSLIALDELFDAVEPQLREVADLVDLFDAYDRLNNEVVAKIPVLQRLQAKLVLKALLLQSLTGEGATAGSIAASMLILDEADPAKAAASVAELVRVFASAMPVEITVDARDGQDERYSFNLTANDALNRALDDAGAGLDPAAPLTAIYRWFRERFPDCSFADGAGLENGWMESELVWRGGIRRGAIGWAVEEKPVSAHPLSEKSVDWEVVIDLRKSAHDDPMPAAGVSRAFWRPGSPSDDEADAIKRFCVLTLSETLRAEFGDAVRAAAHAYSILVERTMNRSFLVDGKLVIDGFDYNFTEDAQTAGNLSALFSTMLEPLFETHFPEHPCFTDTLTEEHAVRLVSDLHHPSRKNLSEVQHFAEAFALPLGIVRSDGASLVPQTEEKLLALPLSSSVMELLSAEGEAPVELDAVARRLAKPPWGLGREAQQLLLSSLVAARQMEYVTAKGDRINHRSLDLRIVWDDIVGVARPREAGFSGKKLARWTGLLTGDPTIGAVEDPEARPAIIEALNARSDSWQRQGLFHRFGLLSDEILNTTIWRTAMRTGNTVATVDSSCAAAAAGSISVEECIERISDAFMDDEERLATFERDLDVIEAFAKAAKMREQVIAELAICEYTDEDAIEVLRDKLNRVLEHTRIMPTDADVRELGYLWEKFRKSYTEHFAVRHDAAMRNGELKRWADAAASGNEWREFTALGRLAPALNTPLARATRLLDRMRSAHCADDVRATLQKQPFCTCSFSLSDYTDVAEMRDAFREEIETGLIDARMAILATAAQMTDDFRDAARRSGSKTDAADRLLDAVNANDPARPFAMDEIAVLTELLEHASSHQIPGVSLADVA